MAETGQSISAWRRCDRLSGKTSSLAAFERFVVYAGVFFAPYANLRLPQVFFTLSDFFFCLSFFILLIAGLIPNRPLGRATSTWLLAFTLLFVGLMAGSLLRGSAERGLIVTTQYLFSYIILMVVLLRNDPQEAHRLAAIFVASIILVDIHGIYTFYAVGYVPGDGKGVVTGGLRLATVLRNPNLAASMNALIMPILLYFWASGRIKAFKGTAERAARRRQGVHWAAPWSNGYLRSIEGKGQNDADGKPGATARAAPFEAGRGLLSRHGHLPHDAWVAGARNQLRSTAR